MSCFSLYSSNNSDSVAFWNAAFGEIKACSVKATPFLKKLSMEVSSLCLPYGKGYFQEEQWSAFLFMAQMSHFVSFRECQFGRDQRSQFEHNQFFKNFLTMKIFVFDLVIKRNCSWYWVFFKYCEYPKSLFRNIQPKTMCRRRLLVALCCLVVRRPNLEVTIKRHLHKQVKIPW